MPLAKKQIKNIEQFEVDMETYKILFWKDWLNNEKQWKSQLAGILILGLPYGWQQP
jgi:hypothetical protein